MLLPHHPYLFDADGKALSSREAKNRPTEKNYIDQLRFTNARIKELVDRIIGDSRTPPVIILQSDEGRPRRNSRFSPSTAPTTRPWRPPGPSSGTGS